MLITWKQFSVEWISLPVRLKEGRFSLTRYLIGKSCCSWSCTDMQGKTSANKENAWKKMTDILNTIKIINYYHKFWQLKDASHKYYYTCSLNKYKYLFFYMTQPNIFNLSLFMQVKYILIYTFIYYCNTLAMICYSNKIPFLKLVFVFFVTKHFAIICILNQCDKSLKVCVFWQTFFT